MDAHAHHADLGHEHVTPLSVYFGIFGALMALTAITVAVAWVNLGSLNILVALGVAVFKASLVVLYFMHLKYSSKLTWIVVGLGVVLDDDPVRHHDGRLPHPRLDAQPDDPALDHGRQSQRHERHEDAQNLLGIRDPGRDLRAFSVSPCLCG